MENEMNVMVESSFLAEELLDSDTVYYTYIKNRYLQGYVYGTLTICCG